MHHDQLNMADFRAFYTTIIPALSPGEREALIKMVRHIERYGRESFYWNMDTLMKGAESLDLGLLWYACTQLSSLGCGDMEMVLECIRIGRAVDEDKLDRSEERRGGKECRSRWSPYH